ncbi:MAG: type II methionyl aminopeptidase [Candidatus Aenigmarchaeota archaeon]|nr:type II methionyl aminopeptidase [Candidatus Aenigmarchaeota archaeon]
MKDDILENYRKAGQTSAGIRKEILETVKPGMKILDLAEKIEKMTTERGCGIAFPVNIGINEITAHYTPTYNDETVIKKGDLVKIDQGLHVDGYVADMAYTFCTENHEYIKTAEEAVKAAIDMIKPGIQISEISKAIYEYVKSKDLGVITNLTGHGLEQYVIHGPPNIPNKLSESSLKLEEGQTIAIEPFVTDSDSTVKESQPVEIYSFLQPRPVRMQEAREILMVSANEFKGLPFAKRWFSSVFPPVKTAMALKQLEQANAIHPYPVLKEVRNKPVAQAEHTIIVLEEPVVTTL